MQRPGVQHRLQHHRPLRLSTTPHARPIDLHACPALPRPHICAAGWAYSEALVRILDDYRRRFPWLWAAIEQDASPGGDAPGGPCRQDGRSAQLARGRAAEGQRRRCERCRVLPPRPGSACRLCMDQGMPLASCRPQASSTWIMCCLSSRESSSWSRWAAWGPAELHAFARRMRRNHLWKRQMAGALRPGLLRAPAAPLG